MRTSRKLVRALALLVSMPYVAPGCSSPRDESAPVASSSSAPTRENPPSDGDAPAAACPAAVPGTSVRVLDIENGAALEVTTTGDVAAVRARSRVMAEHHGISVGDHLEMHRGEDPSSAAHSPALVGGELDERASTFDKTRGLASVSARVEDIDGGARILLVPRGERGRDEVTAVRTHASRVAARMAAGRCPVMMM